MKKTIIVILVLIVILALAGAGAVSAFGGAKTLPQPKAYIFNFKGDVKIKSTGGDWETPVNDREIKIGDMIKTGSDGELSINFYNNSTSRIGPNTETTISQTQIDQYNYSKTKVGITVALGRVWSRIINLSDREATFEVGSNSTVATVRGTTVNFERTKEGEDKINAVESIVSISLLDNATSTAGDKKSPKVLKTVKLTQGSQAIFNPQNIQKDLKVELTPKEILQSPWFAGNEKEDKKFEEEMKKIKEEQNKLIAGTLPDSPLYKIKRLAEDAKLALTFNESEKQNLEVSFLNRRLAESQALIEEGKSGLAESINQEFANQAQTLLGNINNIPDEKIKAEIQGQIQNQINLQNDLLPNLTPDQPGYKIKQALDEFRLQNAPTEEDKKFLLYKDAQQNLKEAEILKQIGNTELYQQQMKIYNDSLKALEQFKNPEFLESIKMLQNVIQNVNLINPMIPNAEKPIIPENLTEQIKQAEQIIQQNIQNPKTPLTPEQIEQIKKLQTPTTETPITPPLIPPTTSPTTEQVQQIMQQAPTIMPPPPSEVKLGGLVVTAPKYNLLANGILQFTAMAVYTDGTRKNVTPNVNWSVTGDFASISGSGLLQGNGNGGVGNVSATYVENGITVSDSSPSVTALTLMQ